MILFRCNSFAFIFTHTYINDKANHPKHVLSGPTWICYLKHSSLLGTRTSAGMGPVLYLFYLTGPPFKSTTVIVGGLFRYSDKSNMELSCHGPNSQDFSRRHVVCMCITVLVTFIGIFFSLFF